MLAATWRFDFLFQRFEFGHRLQIGPQHFIARIFDLNQHRIPQRQHVDHAAPTMRRDHFFVALGQLLARLNILIVFV